MTFEENLTKLEKIVAQMEGGSQPLDKMMALFEEGKALAAACTAELATVRGKIEKLTNPAVTPPETAPFDVKEVAS